MSKQLNAFLSEANNANTKSNLQALIANSFFRSANNPKGDDTRSLLLLIAAITILNSGNDTYTLNIARRLATAGMNSNK